MELSAYVRIKKRVGSAPRCRKCGNKIRVGDKVVSAVVGGSRVNYYIYHDVCFQKTLIEA